MNVYNYDNVSNTVLTIGSYIFPIGGEVTSNGAEIAELEPYVGLGLEKYLNGVLVSYPATMNGAGKLAAKGSEIFAAALTKEEVSLVAKSISTSGLRLAIIGASIEARANPVWAFDQADYVRNNGVVTLQFSYAVADQYFLPGHRIRVACGNRSDIEGAFSVLSCSVNPGVSTTITFVDARSNIAANGLGTAGGQIHDLQSYSVASGWPVFTNMAVGGKLDITIVATGGTNIVTDWGTERISQLASLGTFDAILVGSGLIGNAIKTYGAGPEAVKTAILSLIYNLNVTLKPRVIYFETLPLSRDVASTDPTFTSAENVNRWLWRDLQGLGKNTVVVPGGESMVQNYSAYNVAPSTDIQNSWPEANAVNTDGVHMAYGWSRVRGFTIGEAIRSDMSRWVSPEMGSMAQTRQRSNAPDPDGKYVPNWLNGLWGNVDSTKVTIATTGCSGSAPSGASMSFTTGRGSSTAVSTIQTNPTGGADWITILNGSGSSTGFTFKIEYAPAELLTSLNNVEMQGKLTDLFIPLTFSFNDSKIIWSSLELVAVAGGIEYTIAAPLANKGQYQQAAQSRLMDAGYGGIIKPPRFVVPVATYTSAAIRLTIKEINGSIASGRSLIRFGPGFRLETIQ